MKRQPAFPYKGPRTLGIDVSRWQGTIANNYFDRMARETDIKFCICRTGDGDGVTVRENTWKEDSFFLRNYQKTIDVGWIPGSYHYFRADDDGTRQADFVTALLEKANFEPGKHLPPVLDFESGAFRNQKDGAYTSSGDNIPIAKVHDEALEMLQRLEDNLGVLPLFYTGQSFHWKLAQAHPDWAAEYAKYPLWLASYNDGWAEDAAPARMIVDGDGVFFPWDDWTIWQFTSKGGSAVHPWKGDLDLNWFKGSEADLRKFVASTNLGFLEEADVVSEVISDPVNLKFASDLLERANRLMGEAELLYDMAIDFHEYLLDEDSD